MEAKKDERNLKETEVPSGTNIVTVIFIVFIICMILFLIWLYRRYTA
jgi:flagellar biogenesis protein FliO